MTIINPTVYLLFNGYSIRSTIAVGTDCITLALPPSTISPVHSVAVPSPANPTFLLSAEQEFIQFIGGITCAIADTTPIPIATTDGLASSTSATTNLSTSSPFTTAAQSTSSTFTPPIQSPQPQSSPASQTGGLSIGTKIGIGIGVPVGVIALLLLGWLIRRRNQQRRQIVPRRIGEAGGKERHEADGQEIHELDAKRLQELEGHVGHEMNSERM